MISLAYLVNVNAEYDGNLPVTHSVKKRPIPIPVYQKIPVDIPSPMPVAVPNYVKVQVYVMFEFVVFCKEYCAPASSSSHFIEINSFISGPSRIRYIYLLIILFKCPFIKSFLVLSKNLFHTPLRSHFRLK